MSDNSRKITSKMKLYSQPIVNFVDDDLDICWLNKTSARALTLTISKLGIELTWMQDRESKSIENPELNFILEKLDWVHAPSERRG